MRHFMLGLAISAFGIICVARSATGAGDQAPSMSKSPPATAPDILSGPKVEPEATLQRNYPSRPNAGNDQRREMDIPFPQWVGAVRGLGLSAEQQEQGRAIVAEFQESVREFQAEHGDEMRQLSSEAREARQDGKEPPKSLRDKMKQFEDARPKPDAYKERIWALLNEQQQNQMKARLDAMRKEMTERRNDRRDGRRQQAAPGGGPDVMNEMSTESRSGDEMKPAPSEMKEETKPAQSPTARPRVAAWQAANGGTDAPILSAIGRRRMEFLMAHVAPSSRQSGVPTEAQRHFDFEESTTSSKRRDEPAGEKPRP